MLEQIRNYYENYDEDGRLFRDKAHLPEYLTTIRYFDRLFATGSRILDACAGTGRYSFYLADKGHVITACDIVEHNLNIIRSRPDAYKLAEISLCNTLDLSRFDQDSFDTVLCMGAMYHLKTAGERQKAILECVRVCKPGGFVVLAYITKIGAILANLKTGLENIDGLTKILDGTDEGIFTFISPKEMEHLAKNCGIDKIYNLGVDGMAQAFAEKINAADDACFNKFMEYHYATCEDESITGVSTHGLLIGRKI